MPPASFPTAAPYLPEKISLPTLQEASRICKGCDLYKNATQTVFGEGPANAHVMFVGEQPGHEEDLAGKPFVGPAGRVLDQMLHKVGIVRDDVYVTNAVKHFKWEPRGKRRIHSKPSAREVAACKPWLKAEVQVIQPTVIVTLGATAAQSLLGSQFRVTQRRGQPMHDTTWAPCVIATVHPSSLLRAPDEAARREAFRLFEQDMRIVKKEMDKIGEKRDAHLPQATRRADVAHPGKEIREPEKTLSPRGRRTRVR